jgi:hypothetical protein
MHDLTALMDERGRAVVLSGMISESVFADHFRPLLAACMGISSAAGVPRDQRLFSSLRHHTGDLVFRVEGLTPYEAHMLYEPSYFLPGSAAEDARISTSVGSSGRKPGPFGSPYGSFDSLPPLSATPYTSAMLTPPRSPQRSPRSQRRAGRQYPMSSERAEVSRRRAESLGRLAASASHGGSIVAAAL